MRSASLPALVLGLSAYGCTPAPSPPTEVQLARAWRSETFEGCLLASPLEAEADGMRSVLVASGDGRVVALDPANGTTRWSVALPHPEGQMAHVIATPALVPGPRLVVAWQDVAADSADPAAAPRTAHHVAVVDVRAGRLDAAFPILELAASQPTSDGAEVVPFSPGNALSRSRLVHAPAAGGLGRVYVSFGNARDIQPWHGWVFELDLDAWSTGGMAQAAVLLTTPTTDCGTPGSSGSDDMQCGGGVWAPTGPLFVPDARGAGDDYELIIPTGNGALSLDARLYAHTLMRVHGPGLAFDPGCDPLLCEGFDVLAPDEACLASCADLFVPRLLAGDAPLSAPGCEGLSFFECYALLDWDLGADSPARIELPGGPSVLVLPAKDGAVYLIDADHLGTLYDRHAIITPCGSAGARCDASWAGSMVTRPAVTTDGDGAPLVIISTFMPGERWDAGVVGLRIVMEGGAPRLERAWEEPAFGTPEASSAFRRHPGGLVLGELDGVVHAFVVEQGARGGEPGRLHVIRATDGELRARVDLAGPGQRYAEPLVLPAAGELRLVVPSCEHGNAGPGHLEAWDARPAAAR